MTDFGVGFSKSPKISEAARQKLGGTVYAFPISQKKSNLLSNTQQNLFGIGDYKQNSEIFSKSQLKTIDGEQYLHFATEDPFVFMRINYEIGNVKKRQEDFHLRAKEHFTRHNQEELINYDEELENMDRHHSALPKKITKEEREQVQILAKRAAKKITMIKHKKEDTDLALKVLNMVDSPTAMLRFGALPRRNSP